MSTQKLVSLLPGTQIALGNHEVMADWAPVRARELSQRYSRLRRQQFLSGRGAAAQALSALADLATEVPRSESGAPVWPAGISGSIAHDSEHAIALVGWRRDWLTLGVDVEPDQPLHEDAAEIVLSDLERAAVAAPGEPLRHGRLVFGAKECVHKAIHPLGGVWLDFEEVAIAISDPSQQEGRWMPRALSDPARAAFAGLRFVGRWQRHEGKLLSYLGVQAA
ncbi:MAG: 4'-phosphopantetheinyl transferase superfamily protein [Stagnimonas sp.]|nr:4'-phosphopantetheinyl transferase superfamily protein [Stagnimonas sp.]